MLNVVLGFALLAVVLAVSALASGIVARAPLSFPMIFPGIMLFLDAVNMQVAEIRRDLQSTDWPVDRRWWRVVDRVCRRAFSISRSCQALYGIGLVLLVCAAGQVVQGDGFIATFSGFAVTLSNGKLCNCFLAYGETTAEMAMLPN